MEKLRLERSYTPNLVQSSVKLSVIDRAFRMVRRVRSRKWTHQTNLATQDAASGNACGGASPNVPPEKRPGSLLQSDKMKRKSLGMQIVVIDNGFVHVGDCTIVDDMLEIGLCRNIRQWGTSSGIGELCKGPTSSTKHDECGTVLVPLNRIVFYLKVVGGWK